MIPAWKYCIAAALALFCAACQAQPLAQLKFQASYVEKIESTYEFANNFPPFGGSFPPMVFPPFPGSSGKRMAEAIESGLAGNGLVIETRGSIYVDQLGRVMRYNVKEGRSYFGSESSMIYEMKNLDDNNLLIFDTGRNLTWSNTGGCACDPIDGAKEMLDFAPPPGVSPNSTGVSITVNGSAVVTTYYEFSASSAWGNADSSNPAASLVYGVWVDAQKYTRRILIRTVVGNYRIDYQMDLWNTSALTSAAVLPPIECANKCRSSAIIDATPPTSYPGSSVACNATAGCACQTVLQTGSFCGAVVNYPVNAELYVLVANTQAEASFNAAITVAPGLSQPCKDSLKDYFCRFYVPWCTSGAERKPTLPTCLSDSDKNALYGSGDSAFASSSSIDGVTSGKSGVTVTVTITPKASAASMTGVALFSSVLIAMFAVLHL